MTREELITAMTKGHKGFKFDELPKEYLDSNIIQIWLNDNWGDFLQIPKHFVDDDLRRQAVSMNHDAMAVREYPLSAILMGDTECYEELVLLALQQSCMNMKHVDPALYSEAFFLKALEVNAMSLMMFLTGPPDKDRIEWTQAMIDSAVSKEVNYLKYLPKDKIKRECLERLVTDGEACSTDLEKAGLLGLMSDMMRGGYWPQMMNKPPSLVEAIDLLRQNHASAENLEVYYRAFMRAQPMETVLPLMTSPDLQALMLRVYTTKELMPHLRTGLLKGAAKVRGHLLEEGMGL